MPRLFTVQVPELPGSLGDVVSTSYQVLASSPDEAANLATGSELTRTGNTDALRAAVIWSNAGHNLQRVPFYEKARA